MSLVATNPAQAINILPASDLKDTLSAAQVKQAERKTSAQQLPVVTDASSANSLAEYKNVLLNALRNRSDTPYDLQLESLVARVGDNPTPTNLTALTDYMKNNIDFQVGDINLRIRIANALIDYAKNNKVNELSSTKNNQEYTMETLMMWQKYVTAKLAEQKKLQQKLKRSVETRRRENVFNLTDKASIKTWKRVANIAFVATVAIALLYFCVQHYQTLTSTVVRLRGQFAAMKKNITQQQ